MGLLQKIEVGSKGIPVNANSFGKFGDIRNKGCRFCNQLEKLFELGHITHVHLTKQGKFNLKDHVEHLLHPLGIERFLLKNIGKVAFSKVFLKILQGSNGCIDGSGMGQVIFKQVLERVDWKHFS